MGRNMQQGDELYIVSMLRVYGVVIHYKGKYTGRGADIKLDFVKTLKGVLDVCEKEKRVLLKKYSIYNFCEF